MAAAVMAPASLPAQTVPGDFKITLERTSCFGALLLGQHRCGRERDYEGKKFVRIEGRTSTPDKQDSEGRTALWIAATWGNHDVANLLLSAGADPTFVARNGRSVLEVAKEGRASARNQHAQVFKRGWPFDEDFDRTIALIETRAL